MKVKEFREWLKQFPDDAVVQVSCQESDHWSVWSRFREFDPKDVEQWDYTDFHGNKFVKEDAPYHDMKFLALGSVN